MTNTPIEKIGFGARTIAPAYEGVDAGVPLMQKFYTMFTGTGVDHHINQLMVQPDGNIQDLAPNADPGFASSNPSNGDIRISFQDQAGNDEFFFNVGHLVVDGITRHRMRDVGCTGTCMRRLPDPPAPGMRFVLIGFQIAFVGGRDHHIDELAIMERNGVLHVSFNDKNDDDVFAYAVDFAWVPSRMVSSTGSRSGSARGGDEVAILEPFIGPPYHVFGHKVLSGFRFNFARKDHHIRDIGVLLFSDKLQVFYGDKNFDDLFEWEVHWTTISQELEIFRPL
jgi:hypothetical protein